MNLTLHHFLKEFRYLQLRWFAFLVLLVFDLAVNLEWLFPLRAGAPERLWLNLMPFFLVVLAVISSLSGCPEDRPGSDRSFISTRPLALRSYWLARVGIWLGLMVLPLVLQNVIYLALSHRPWGDVLRGAFERGWMVTGLTAFLLPLSSFLRRGEDWWIAAVVAVTVTAFSKLLDGIAMKWFDTSFSADTTAALTAGLACFGLGAIWLAWRQQRQDIAPRRKLAWITGLTCAATAIAGWWPFQDPNTVPQDERLVQKFAPGLKVHFDLPRYQFDGFDSDWSQFINAYTDIETGHSDIHAMLRNDSSVVTQNGRRFNTKTRSGQGAIRSTINSKPTDVMRSDRVLRDLFPAGTLFVYTGPEGLWRNDDQTLLAKLTEPFPNPDQSLRIESDYTVDWFRRDRAIDLPLAAGSNGQGDSDAWSILRVQEHKGRDGAQQGSVSVDIRWDHREHWDRRDSVVPVLYSPERQLVWLMPLPWEFSLRGELTGWSRGTMRFNWQGVLNYADGEDAGVKVANLRLILLRSRYLGSSRWSWKSPDIRLADYSARSNDRRRIPDSEIYKGREVKAFRERIATLKPPTADSAESEVRRYLYDVLSATHKTKACYQKSGFADVTNAFRPLAQYHLPQLLQIPSEMWPGWTNRPPITILDEYLKDEHRDFVIDLLPVNQRLIQTVIKKGWTEQSKRLEPRILARPQLPYGVEDLLLAWGDEASHERLINEQQRWPRDSTMEGLDKVPSLRPRLEQIARETYAKIVPVLSENAAWDADHLAIATDFGVREALDVSLRWRALAGDQPSNRRWFPSPNLLDADGSKFWKDKVDEAQQWPRYRHVKADDFDYLPEKRAWKLRTP